MERNILRVGNPTTAVTGATVISAVILALSAYQVYKTINPRPKKNRRKNTGRT